ncbi:hypothetical protein THASP1DRAFT_32099 [Thamnocephalis sphaerospora]|uniref:Glyoxylate reductase n=1 Tax=Thamnocephalis sphaerospora TaxID=78915 RepID=A0A4P9XJZ8_9FUNG|nr:hypothetical protein THASP1DRAFT_32099 [Thamnocephalis sphaerospora]|eukprot:RKP06072.1 hypothetical protein THASP1DRAFT_32099 [Thamnocephalis sphaerospora]
MATTNTPARVIVTFPLPEQGQRLLENYACKHDWELIQWRDSEINMTRGQFLDQVNRGADGILCKMTIRIDEDVLARAGDRLKVVSTMTVGCDHIDCCSLKARNVPLGHTPGVLTDATADLAVALTLAVCRRLGEAMQAVCNGEWGAWNPTWLLGTEIRGKTLGVLGLGRIGLATAKRLRAFGVSRLIYHSTKEKPEAAQVDGEFVTLEQLLRESDILCICCSLNASTRHMIGYTQLCAMKPTAILVNVARGDVIVQDDLERALREGKIAAAGLDVTTPEPLPPSHPLANMKNCIVLPHIGSATVETRNAMSVLAVENLLAGLQGRKMPAEYV